MRPESPTPDILLASDLSGAKWFCLRSQPKREPIAVVRLRQCEGQNGVVKQLLPARERVEVLLEVLGGATEVDLCLTPVFKEAAVLV